MNKRPYCRQIIAMALSVRRCHVALPGWVTRKVSKEKSFDSFECYYDINFSHIILPASRVF